MKLTIVVPAATGLAIGYTLGAAAGRGRYRQIVTGARSLITHPAVQQAAFDLAGQVKKYGRRVPGPAAHLVDDAATRLQDTLTQPEGDHDAAAGAEPSPAQSPAQ